MPNTIRMGSIPARAGETLSDNPPRLVFRVYPRTGGGNRGGGLFPAAGGGLSPHGRGKLGSWTKETNCSRSIPARAGETVIGIDNTPQPEVYPRTGGGNRWSMPAGSTITGLSPHGRGKLSQIFYRPHSEGSIPARAGETGKCLTFPRCHTVYPRTGGGNDHQGRGVDAVAGLSPHGRGKRCALTGQFLGKGSIPARAGETLLHRRSGRR